VCLSREGTVRCAGGCRPWDRKNHHGVALELVAATLDTFLIAQGNQGKPDPQPGRRFSRGSQTYGFSLEIAAATAPLPSWDHGVVMGFGHGGARTAGTGQSLWHQQTNSVSACCENADNAVRRRCPSLAEGPPSSARSFSRGGVPNRCLISIRGNHRPGSASNTDRSGEPCCFRRAPSGGVSQRLLFAALPSNDARRPISMVFRRPVSRCGSSLAAQASTFSTALLSAGRVVGPTTFLRSAVFRRGPLPALGQNPGCAAWKTCAGPPSASCAPPRSVAGIWP